MTLVGAKGVEEAVETLGTGAEPGSTESLLAPCLAEGRGPNQRLPVVGPAIGVSAVGVVVVQVRGQACDEFLGRGEVAALQEAASQGAEPQFDLVEPRAVLGREVEDVLVIGIGQEGASLLAGAQILLVERQAVEFRQEFADVQAPMGVQVVEDPMATLLVGECGLDEQRNRRWWVSRPSPTRPCRWGRRTRRSGNGRRGGCIRVLVYWRRNHARWFCWWPA
jgi:hypothetical protein